MSTQELIELIPADEANPRIQAALAELRKLILRRFPDATFETVHRDDPDGIYLIATVDVDDLDEVTGTVLSRMVDMQIEEGLPVYVVPDWPLARVREQRNRKASERPVSDRPAPATT